MMAAGGGQRDNGSSYRTPPHWNPDETHRNGMSYRRWSQEIALWVMLDILQHTLQCRDFREDQGKGIAPLQHADKFTGDCLTQGAAGFLPDPFGNKRSQLARRADPAHEIKRFRGNCKAASAIPGRKARNPQYP